AATFKGGRRPAITPPRVGRDLGANPGPLRTSFVKSVSSLGILEQGNEMHLDAYIRLLLLPYWRYPAVPSVLQLGTRRCVKVPERQARTVIESSRPPSSLRH